MIDLYTIHVVHKRKIFMYLERRKKMPFLWKGRNKSFKYAQAEKNV